MADPTHLSRQISGRVQQQGSTGSNDCDTVQKVKIDEATTSKHGKRGTRPRDSKWEDMYQRLLVFKDKHGNVNVPTRFVPDPQLGRWVSYQRQHYRKKRSDEGHNETAADLERERKLNDVGFQWTIVHPSKVSWDYRFAELVKFKERFGHCQVPIGWKENLSLSNWVSAQRQELSLVERGCTDRGRLSANQIERLNCIDFVWKCRRGGPRKPRSATITPPASATPLYTAYPPNNVEYRKHNFNCEWSPSQINSTKHEMQTGLSTSTHTGRGMSVDPIQHYFQVAAAAGFRYGMMEHNVKMSALLNQDTGSNELFHNPDIATKPQHCQKEHRIDNICDLDSIFDIVDDDDFSSLSLEDFNWDGDET